MTTGNDLLGVIIRAMDLNSLDSRATQYNVADAVVDFLMDRIDDAEFMTLVAKRRYPNLVSEQQTSLMILDMIQRHLQAFIDALTEALYTEEATTEKPPFEAPEWKEDDLESVVYQAIGAASVCWESIEGAFDARRAAQIGEALLDRIRAELPS